jgi:putative ABC transport system permease protein
MKPGESVISPSTVDVTPGYFEALQVKLVSGRFIDERDGHDAPKVIMVDETLAKRFWPNRNPIGRRMYRPGDINNLLAITDKTVFFTVIGVVHDLKLRDLAEGKTTVGAYFFPMDQDISSAITFAVRTAGDPTALSNSVRGALSELDPELPVFELQTMAERKEKSLVSRRSPVLLSLSFGTLALLLSAIGIYGVLAYLVTQRRKEIGIRIALGSSARGVFELVLREGLTLIAIGLLLGVAGTIALRRTLESQLFGLTAGDPIVLATVTLVLAAVAILACALPARRATRIEPIVALAE